MLEAFSTILIAKSSNFLPSFDASVAELGRDDIRVFVADTVVISRGSIDDAFEDVGNSVCDFADH